MTDEEKFAEERFQIYTPHNVFIKGWYTIEELQEVIATMRRIIRANKEITKESEQTNESN
jgi:hypothetical protein